MTPETIAAMAIGMVVSFPVIPALCNLLRFDSVKGTALPGGGGSQVLSVHAIPTYLLITGLVVCMFLLSGNTLNPFLYFRF